MKKVLHILLGIVIAGIAIEMLLQLTDDNNYDAVTIDRKSGLNIYWPSSTFTVSSECYENTVTVNSIGFHAPEPPPKDKKDNEFRIIILGNSFIEGVHVPVDHLATTLLENMLNEMPNKKYKYIVIPIAFSGNNLTSEIQYLKAFGISLKPDLIVTTNYNEDGNLNIIRTLSDKTANPTKIALMFDKLSRISKLFRNLRRVEIIASEEIRYFGQTSILSGFSHPKQSDHESLLNILSTISSQSHAKFFNADIYDEMQSTSKITGQKITLDCDMHWNKNGHRLAAQILFEQLQKNPALLTR